MEKIVDQSERRIQAQMDPRAHMQHQTDLPNIQARGTVTKGHMGGHQSNLEAVGAT